MSDLHFFPYLRRGLARHIAGADPGSGLVGPAAAPMSLAVAGETIATTVSLLAPHHVASLSPSEIVRRYPTPNAVEIEPNYFPLVEFAAPDLPWRFSPAAPGPNGRLRPWIVLVVVEADSEEIEYTVSGDGTGRLTIASTQLGQLPPIDDGWAWAHVQSLVAAEVATAAASSDPASLRSRLVCPRRLDAGVTYRAALVNAFREGAGQQSEPAWGGDGGVTLTVYDTWTFTTSADYVNFELLCDRLLPDVEGGALGVRAVDVGEPGIPVDWPRRRMSIDLVGALADVAVITTDPPAGTPAFAEAVIPMLNDALGRGGEPATPADYDPLEDDPVVGLPFYASWPAAVGDVPRAGWPRELNVHVDARIAAGLGAKTVRRNQESLMAAAWDQLGQVREASDELNRGRLSAEVGRGWQARVAALDAGDRIGVAAPLLTYLRVEGRPAREVVAKSLAPKAIVDRAWLRRTPRPRAASASTAFLHGARPAASERELRAFGYQAIAQPAGLHAIETQLDVSLETGGDAPILSPVQVDWVRGIGLATAIGGNRLDLFVRGRLVIGRPDPAGSLPTHGAAAGVPSTARPSRPPRPQRPPRPPRPAGLRGSRAHPATGDVAAVVARMNPLTTMRAALVARMPGLGDLLPAGELPAALSLAPQFTDALFWDLAAFDADVIVPGLEGFANNRVRLLGVNGKFVAAYLAGANHEMAREFVWREYPADLAATFFQRFFAYVDVDAVDIEAIAGWTPRSSLANNAPGAAATTVILIRADLIRRYPDANIFIAPQGRSGSPDYTRQVQPSFEGRLSSDVLLVGFPLAPDVVLGQTGGPEYFVVFEERVTAPRFGLDIERSGTLTTWDELAWTDFGPGTADPAGTHIGPGPIGDLGTPEIDNVVWGRNAAHMAAAVHRRPFRRVYPAGRLINV